MSGDSGDRHQSADHVRARNHELDAELRNLFRRVPADRLREDPGDGEWTLAQNLAHIAEFPRYFAVQLGQWIADERSVVGRVAEHDADRNDAIVRAEQRTLAEHSDAAEESFAALTEVLRGLRDEHLTTQTHNVKYGEEPLTAFLDRYVIGHKAAHVRQLRETLERLGA